MAKKPIYTSYADAVAAYEAHRPLLAERGISFDGARAYVPESFRSNYALAQAAMAMDAPTFQPGMQTDPNSGVPWVFTNYVDPTVIEILFSPTKAAEVLGEERKGDWVMDTMMLPVTEQTGEVSSYGDRNNNGRAGINANWPQRQNYVFQVMLDYGDREVARAGLARINLVSEVNRSAASILNRYSNLTQLFGVMGLQNYGLTNDPNLPAALTPAVKANGGTGWFTAGGSPNATALEVYNDLVSLYEALVQTNNGNVDENTPLTLALSPGSAVALNFANSFNVSVRKLLTDNYPSLKIVTVPQYGAQTASNSQGSVAGNLVQLIATTIEGQKAGYSAYSEKLKSFPIIRKASSFEQKQVSGTWGVVIRMANAFSQMIGV